MTSGTPSASSGPPEREAGLWVEAAWRDESRGRGTLAKVAGLTGW